MVNNGEPEKMNHFSLFKALFTIFHHFLRKWYMAEMLNNVLNESFFTIYHHFLRKWYMLQMLKMMHLKHLKHCSPFPGNGEQWYTVQMVNNALNDAFPCKCYQWEMVHHLVYHFLRKMRHFLRKCMHFSRKCVTFYHCSPLFTIFHHLQKCFK